DNQIRPRYDARGRVLVAFPTIKTERAQDVDGVVVTVAVTEGPEFKLGDVKIGGSYAPKSAQLLKLAKFKTGEAANFDEVTQSLDRIKRLLRRQGYMRAETTIERAVHNQNKTVDLTVRIDEGPQF